MTKRKIEVKENEISITIEKLEKLCKEMQPLKIGYEKLNIGNFTDDIFNSIKNDAGAKAIEDYMLSVHAELNKMGVNNAVNRQTFLLGHEGVTGGFLEMVTSVFELKNSDYRYLDFNNISYSNGSFIVSKENRQVITEANTIYIDDKDQSELYDQLQDYVKQMEKINRQMNKIIGFKLPDHVEVNSVLKEFFVTGLNNTFEVKPEGLKLFVRKYKKK